MVHCRDPNNCPLIALLRDGKPSLGVTRTPLSSHTWLGEQGRGDWQIGPSGELRRCVDDRILRSSEELCVCLRNAWVNELDPSLDKPLNRPQPLIRTAQRFRVHGDCFQHVALADGKIHVAVGSMMKPWGSAVRVPILLESNAVSSDVDGSDVEAFSSNGLMSASTRDVRDEAIRCISARQKA